LTARDDLRESEGTMTLTQELKALAGAYLNKRSSLEDIRAWLIDHAQDVVDAADPRLDDLDGELWLLISEYDRRDRDEASVRTELGRLLRPALTPTSHGISSPT
jgi:hypothetical protein